MPQLFNKIVGDTPEQQAKIDEIMRRGEEERRQIARENLLDNARIAGGALLSGASALPFFNIPYIGTGIGGAMEGAGQAIMKGKSRQDIAKDAGIGFAIGETVGAIPYAGKLAGKTNAGQAVAKKASGLYDKIIHTDAGTKVANALDRDIAYYTTLPIKRKFYTSKIMDTSPFAKGNAQVAYDIVDGQYDNFTNKTGMSRYDDVLDDAFYAERKQLLPEIVDISPEEYLRLTNKGFNDNYIKYDAPERVKDFETFIQRKTDNQLDPLREAFNTNQPMDIPMIEYITRPDGTIEMGSQEGIHRAIVARELGIDKMPVAFFSGKNYGETVSNDVLKENLSNITSKYKNNEVPLYEKIMQTAKDLKRGKNNPLKNIENSAKIKGNEGISKHDMDYLTHELNNNLTAKERTKKVIKRPVGDYVFRVKNNGFNDYEYMERQSIDDILNN